MASPVCQVKDGGGAYAPTTNGFNTTSAGTTTIALVSSAGVKTWSIACTGTDDRLVAATINAGLTIDGVGLTCALTAPAAGSALLFTSTVTDNGGVTTSTTFCIYTLTPLGLRVGAVGETIEGSAAYGTAATINAAIRVGAFGGSFAKTLTAAQSYDLAASEVAMQSLEFVSNGANVIRLTPVTTLSGTYFRFIQNVSGGGTLTVKDTNNVAAAASLASGNGAWFRFSTAAVKQITAAFAVA